jgi:hypothetical protein
MKLPVSEDKLLKIKHYCKKDYKRSAQAAVDITRILTFGAMKVKKTRSYSDVFSPYALVSLVKLLQNEKYILLKHFILFS